MIVQFDAIANDAVLRTDVCIIGAGASGLSIAREFVGTAVDVIVVESGEFGIDEAYEALNDGEIGETPFIGLREGRRRGLGGTTAAWGGQCCELDANDFLQRSWIPDSGWPIAREELEPFYRRAELIFGVHGERYDETNWLRFGLKPLELKAASLRTAFSVFSPRPRLGKVYRKLVSEARNARVVLGATVCNIQTTKGGSTATRVDVKGLNGRRAQIGARVFVLATGTIESARLLLVSRDAAPNGLGNDRDLVGRYFQDHPTSATAAIVPTDTERLQDIYGVLYRGRTWYWPKLALAPAQQCATKSLNASAFVTFEYGSSAIEVLRQMVRTTRTGGRFDFSTARIARLVRGSPSVIDAGYRRYILGRSPRAKPSRVDLTCTIEQAPNRDSRVILTDSRDRLGMQRVRVDWKISDLERHTFRVMTQCVDDEFQRLGIGKLIPRTWLKTDEPSAWVIHDNYHQTGTTRMSADPAHGVVDLNCQIHGVQGLFVSGAPTFPTSGYANPVLTIAAMSIRLSDHLKRVLFT
jgi:choline dehydrogenase-like flavoprotein